jgi:hypothetical protein
MFIIVPLLYSDALSKHNLAPSQVAYTNSPQCSSIQMLYHEQGASFLTYIILKFNFWISNFYIRCKNNQGMIIQKKNITVKKKVVWAKPMRWI